MKKAVSGIILALLLIGSLTLMFDIQPAKADWTWTETIYIWADGSVNPDTAPISSSDNITYTLTDNIVGDVPKDTWAIVVERDNIVVDGVGYTLQGNGSGFGFYLSDISNVTIKNANVKDFGHGGICFFGAANNTVSGNSMTNNIRGIWLYHAKNNTVSGNSMTNNQFGIELFSAENNTVSGNSMTNNSIGVGLVQSSNNTVSGNSMTNNSLGIYGHYSSDNMIFHNSFINNTGKTHVMYSNNTWDNGYPSGGNYWSDHNPPDIYSGPYQNETGRDGIGDLPYVIDENNTDSYPLIYPYGYVPSPDLNDDGKITIIDIVICALAFGSKPGDPRWNPYVDLNQDGKVTITDIVMIALHFGETW